MTQRDRAGDPTGHGAGRRGAAGDAGHRQGFPTPADTPTAGSPARPGWRLPQVLWAKAFGRRNACGQGPWLAMLRSRLGDQGRRTTRFCPKTPTWKHGENRLYGSLSRTFGIILRPACRQARMCRGAAAAPGPAARSTAWTRGATIARLRVENLRKTVFLGQYQGLSHYPPGLADPAPAFRAGFAACPGWALLLRQSWPSFTCRWSSW